MTKLKLKASELRTEFQKFLDKEATVRSLLKATLPLWGSLVLAVVLGIGALAWQANQREQETAARRTDSCQIRNTAQQAGRYGNDGIIGVVEDNLPDPEINQELRESQAPAALIDTDCDGDGLLTLADYVPGADRLPEGLLYPVGLPLLKEEPPS